jgi:hypothetical protein
LRLLCVVEHFPEIVLSKLQSVPKTYEWYRNDWMKLVVIHPETKEIYLFKSDQFVPYTPQKVYPKSTENLQKLVESTHGNIPVHQIINN